MTQQLRYLILCLLCGSLSVLVPNNAHGQSLQFVGCDNGEQARIKERFRWLRTQASAIIDGVSTHHPASWKGNSQKRFRSLFRSPTLRIECTRAQKLCDTPTQTVTWRDTTYPAPHRYPLTLCMDLLLEPEALTTVIIHLLAHHVLLNQDQSDCVKRCEQPRLADALTMSAQSLMTGEAFSLEWCLTACAPKRDLDATVVNDGLDAGFSTQETVPPTDEREMRKTPTVEPTKLSSP